LLIKYSIAVAFGGSGFKSKLIENEDDGNSLLLLAAPIKMIDNTDLKPKKSTYGGAVLTTNNNFDDEISISQNLNSNNSALDSAAIPTTQVIIFFHTKMKLFIQTNVFLYS
jgi:hypothetical protein